LENAEMEKKRKYQSLCLARKTSFTPLVTSEDEMLGIEFKTLLKAVGETDAPSYLDLSYETILENAEMEKKRKYQSLCLARKASFTPLVTSEDEMLGIELKTFLRAVGERLCEKWHKPYSVVMN